MDLGARPKDTNPCLPATADETIGSDSDSYVSIEILPNEILEYILCFISPYTHLDSCARVSWRWRGCCRRVASVRAQQFRGHAAAGSLVWRHQPVAADQAVASISKRYSHCAVSCPDTGCMYVFGGCTSTSSTFNDLWELNLSTRTWRRPLSMGTYPSPKACASMVKWEDKLILFGGWTHPSLYPLHQSWKLFSELHIYHMTENRWALMSSEQDPRPPAMAGHSATVHGKLMIVFGGLHKQRSVGHYTSSNDIWVYNLESGTWERRLTGGVLPPLARYGQSQLYLDQDHLLVLGGCGGPNNEYTDIWLLDMTYSPWAWIQMEVRGHEHRARDLWCHPAVRVGDVAVVLGKCRAGTSAAQQPAAAAQPQQWNVTPQLRRGSSRGQAGPRRGQAGGSAPAPHHARRSVSSSDSDMDLAVEPLQAPGPRGGPGAEARPPPVFRTSVSLNIAGPSSAQAAPATVASSSSCAGGMIPVRVSPAHSKVLGPAANTGNQDPGLAGPAARAAHHQDSHQPLKNRQKMLENRQRQLASLQRMEEKIRNSSRSQQPQARGGAAASAAGSGEERGVCPHHRMTTHTLDISRAISEHYVSWLPTAPASSVEAPQESILYSLVVGRAELVMFGGLQKDVTISGGRGQQQNNTESVSNCLFYLNPPQLATN